MIKIFCDICEKPADLPDFRFEGQMVKISQISTLGVGQQIQPQMNKKNIHLCEKCYEEKLGI